MADSFSGDEETTPTQPTSEPADDKVSGDSKGQNEPESKPGHGTHRGYYAAPEQENPGEGGLLADSPAKPR